MNVYDLQYLYEDIKLNEFHGVAKHPEGHAAIYLICDHDHVIYVGATTNLKNRLSSQLTRVEFYGKDIFYFWWPIDKCKEMEAEIIVKIRPEYNYNIPGVVLKRMPIPHYPRVKRPALVSKEDMHIIRGEIRMAMGKKDLTVSKLASLVNIHRQTVTNILSYGDIQLRSLSAVEIICKKLGIRVPKWIKDKLKILPQIPYAAWDRKNT